MFSDLPSCTIEDSSHERGHERGVANAQEGVLAAHTLGDAIHDEAARPEHVV
jgi:hypothetical protein